MKTIKKNGVEKENLQFSPTFEYILSDRASNVVEGETVCVYISQSDRASNAVRGGKGECRSKRERWA